MNIHWLTSVSFVALLGLLLFVAGCTSHPAEPNADVVVEEPFGPEQARRALLERFGPGHGEEFAQRLRDAPWEISEHNKNWIHLHRFDIDLMDKTYHWVQVPRRPGERMHSIEWDGKFERDAKGKWVATKPSETHAW